MRAKDQPTLDFYAKEAETYALRYVVSDQLAAFLARIAPGGRILELGCGGGQDSAAMIGAGFDAVPTDGSAELAQQAEKRIGRPVRVLLFEDIVFDNEFDGVFANACLLHVPRQALAAILAKVQKALRPGGLLYASFKTGEPEGADRFGRYYNQPDAKFLTGALGQGWSSVEIVQAAGSGYYNIPAQWLHVTAVKGDRTAGPIA